VYGRLTIGITYSQAVTPVAAAFKMPKPGLYRVANLGPNIVYMRMDARDGATYSATITDMPLFPAGSGDECSLHVEVGAQDVKDIAAGTGLGGGHPAGPGYLHFVCAAMQSATLRITRMTKD